jgi:hypothetical protein
MGESVVWRVEKEKVGTREWRERKKEREREGGRGERV